MTLSVAWIRRVNQRVHELVFASDSRLSGGETWDRCPKIFQLPRTDSLISFSGWTVYAFPLLLQLINAIASYGPSRRRSTDLADVKGHALRVFNEMYNDVRDLPRGEIPGDPDAQFTFGGWSWRDSAYRLWYLDWDHDQRVFTFRAVREWSDRPGVWLWFDGSRDAVYDARAALPRLLNARGVAPEQGLDMEPFELLVAAIRSGKYRDVGGAPQIAKVYRHLNTQLFTVGWTDREGPQKFLAGRPLLSYENVDVPHLDASSAPFPSDASELLAQVRDDRNR